MQVLEDSQLSSCLQKSLIFWWLSHLTLGYSFKTDAVHKGMQVTTGWHEHKAWAWEGRKSREKKLTDCRPFPILLGHLGVKLSPGSREECGGFKGFFLVILLWLIVNTLNWFSPNWVSFACDATDEQSLCSLSWPTGFSFYVFPSTLLRKWSDRAAWCAPGR